MSTNFNKHSQGKKPVFLLFILIGLFGTSAVVMYLWNKIMPGVTGLKPISYAQALGIFILSRLLFGNFGFGNRSVKPYTDHPPRKPKFMEMSEEEQQQFKEEWNKRCS